MHILTSVYKDQSNNRPYYFALACIVAIGVFLRLSQLGVNDVWIDEAVTGFLATTRDGLGYLRTDNNPPLYYLLQRGWCSIVTCNEFGLRLTSVLAGTFFIILIGGFCRQLYGKKIALSISLLAAVSPLNIYYSQEARVYSILVTVLLLFLYLQRQVIQNGATRGRLILLFLASTTALYLHFFALIVVCTCLLVYGAEALTGRRQVAKSYFVIIAGSLLVFLPWAVYGILSNDATRSDMQWIAGYLADKPLWQLPLRSITTFLVGMQSYNNEINLFVKRYSSVDTSTGYHLFYIILTVAYLCLYMITLLKIRYFSRETRMLLMELSGFVILPLAGLIVISLLIEPAYVVGRYDQIAYPAFLLLTGCVLHVLAGKQDIQIKWSYSTAVTLLVLLAGVSLSRDLAYMSAPPYRGIKSEVSAVLDTVRNGDGLLVANTEALLVLYYIQATGYDRTTGECIGPRKRFVCRLFPEKMEQTPELQENYTDLYKDPDSTFNIDYFLKALTPDSRVLLLLQQVTIDKGKMTLTPVDYRLFSRLLDAGYKVKNIVAKYNLILFSKASGSAGSE